MADDTQQSPLLDLNQMMPDPTAVQGAVADQWQQRLQQVGNNPILRNQIMMQMYGQNLRGGDPRVMEAAQQRRAMQGILQQVNDAAPDNEDPLDYQQRLSTAMLKGMSTVNPQIAMAASQNLVRIQQARQQRDLLSADVSSTQAVSSINQEKAAVEKAIGGKIVFARQGDADANGVPEAPEAVATLDVNDPGFSQQAAQLQDDAKQGGYALMPMTPDQFMSNKTQLAQLRANAAVQAAQIRANAAIQAAAFRASQTGATMDGRSFQMAARVLSGAEMASAGVQNVANMEFGAHSPSLGNGFRGSTGESIFEGSRDTLRNELTPQEQQQYTSFAQPIWRGISAIESQGGLQGGQQLATQVQEGLALRPGDTPLTIMGKLAQARQDIERGTAVQLANPRLDPIIRKQVSDAVSQLSQAIPFTVADVENYTRSLEKNPKLTYRQWAAQQQLGDTAATTNPQPGAPGSAQATGMVRVKRPDGAVGTIPVANLQKALAAGYTKVQ